MGEKIKCGILGATGTVGQRFIQLLHQHPWFTIVALGASEKSAGVKYVDAAQNWKLPFDIPECVKNIEVTVCDPKYFTDCQIVFSGLDSSVAGEVEINFMKADIAVFSNAKNHRMDPEVPLVVPTVNSAHLDMIPLQRKKNNLKNGFLVCNANCSTTGLVVPLQAIHEKHPIEMCIVTTLQALSGAGYPGVPSSDLIDNIIPYISGEEEKIEIEPRKIMGTFDEKSFSFLDADIKLSATCNRVAVIDGHTECVEIKFKGNAPTIEQIKEVLNNYNPAETSLNIPSLPKQCVKVLEGNDRPQPKLDRDAGAGYTVTVGRIRNSPIFDMKMTVLSHNTILGAAGSSVLNAEIAKVKGLFD